MENIKLKTNTSVIEMLSTDNSKLVRELFIREILTNIESYGASKAFISHIEKNKTNYICVSSDSKPFNSEQDIINSLTIGKSGSYGGFGQGGKVGAAINVENVSDMEYIIVSKLKKGVKAFSLKFKTQTEYIHSDVTDEWVDLLEKAYTDKNNIKRRYDYRNMNNFFIVKNNITSLSNSDKLVTFEMLNNISELKKTELDIFAVYKKFVLDGKNHYNDNFGLKPINRSSMYEYSHNKIPFNFTLKNYENIKVSGYILPSILINPISEKNIILLKEQKRYADLVNNLTRNTINDIPVCLYIKEKIDADNMERLNTEPIFGVKKSKNNIYHLTREFLTFNQDKKNISEYEDDDLEKVKNLFPDLDFNNVSATIADIHYDIYVEEILNTTHSISTRHTYGYISPLFWCQDGNKAKELLKEIFTDGVLANDIDHENFKDIALLFSKKSNNKGMPNPDIYSKPTGGNKLDINIREYREDKIGKKITKINAGEKIYVQLEDKSSNTLINTDKVEIEGSGLRLNYESLDKYALICDKPYHTNSDGSREFHDVSEHNYYSQQHFPKKIYSDLKINNENKKIRIEVIIDGMDNKKNQPIKQITKGGKSVLKKSDVWKSLDPNITCEYTIKGGIIVLNMDHKLWEPIKNLCNSKYYNSNVEANANQRMQLIYDKIRNNIIEELYYKDHWINYVIWKNDKKTDFEDIYGSEVRNKLLSELVYNEIKDDKHMKWFQEKYDEINNNDQEKINEEVVEDFSEEEILI